MEDEGNMALTKIERSRYARGLRKLDYGRWGWPMMILASGFALSRVYCGVHYPADILAGFALGAGAAWFLTRFSGWLDWVFDLIIGLVRRIYLA